MNRNIFREMLRWKEVADNKPLLLYGAKGVGKTYLAIEFAKKFYEQYFYLNLKTDNSIRKAIQEERKPIRLRSEEEMPSFLLFVQKYYQLPIEYMNQFFFIFDDIQYEPSLMHWLEKEINHLSSIPMLLITTQKPSKNMKQQCHCLEVSGLDFDEYLSFVGLEWYTEIIEAHVQKKKNIPDIVHQEMINQFENYLRIGGMPAVLNEYIRMEGFENLCEIQKDIYSLSISELLEESKTEEGNQYKIQQICASIGFQLCKENKNFRFHLLRKGMSYPQYEKPLESLIKNHIVNRINRQDPTRIIEGNKENIKQFRLYPKDCGILFSILQTDLGNRQENHDKIMQLLLEAYLLQTLNKIPGSSFYWESGSKAKIDFLFWDDNSILPIEAKYIENKRSKSLHEFYQKYPISQDRKSTTKIQKEAENINVQETNKKREESTGLISIKKGYRFGLQNFQSKENVELFPIYSIFCLPKLFRQDILQE